MKICITGAGGFIGTHLSRLCLDQGHQVHMIDNNWQDDHPFGGNITHLNHNTYDIDVANVNNRWHNDYERLETLFNKIKPDVCYHLAAYAAEQRSSWIRSFIHQNNTVGTANIINACVNYKCKLVFTSSVAVMSGEPPFDESMTPKPIDSYGVSKYCSEMDIQIAGELQELDWCIIRPRNVYGEWQCLFDRARNLFGIWCYNALNNLPLTVFGDGSNTRTFTYINDIIPCLYRAKDVSKEIINLGSFLPTSIIAAANTFHDVTGYSKIIHTEKRHEVPDAFCRIEKSEELLGFNDNTSLFDGLTKMWAWAKQQKMRPLDVMPALETTVGAHSSLK